MCRVPASIAASRKILYLSQISKTFQVCNNQCILVFCSYPTSTRNMNSTARQKVSCLRFCFQRIPWRNQNTRLSLSGNRITQSGMADVIDFPLIVDLDVYCLAVQFSTSASRLLRGSWHVRFFEVFSIVPSTFCFCVQCIAVITSHGRSSFYIYLQPEVHSASVRTQFAGGSPEYFL